MRGGLRLIIVLSIVALLLISGAEVASAQGGSRIHVVQWGEHLSGIAQYYGTTVSSLMAANGLYNANYITAGQVLVIPSGWAPARQVHTVQWGENLFRIGLHYGYDVNTMAAANNLWNPNYITAGQTLVVPRTHIVRYGEYLSLIARNYGSSVNAILWANNIYNANLIYPGQRLVIP